MKMMDELQRRKVNPGMRGRSRIVKAATERMEKKVAWRLG